MSQSLGEESHAAKQTPQQASQGGGGGGPPPWSDPSMQSDFEFRNDDVVVSVPFKSGTTWSMNIVHQLRTGGNADFEDIYQEIPWIEFIERPGQTKEELFSRWNGLPPRRGFKTHGTPPILPFNPNVKYLIVLRNPEEVCVSAKVFFEKHTKEFIEGLWKTPKAAFCRDTFEQFFHDVFIEGKLLEMMLFGFVKAWWPYRNEPNVCMIHYNDMKKDHAGSLRYIAKKLGFEPTEEQWPNILKYTSFAWMKAHQERFEAATVAPVPLLYPGGMVRKGQAGHAADDGMTPEIARIIRQEGERILSDDKDAIEYYYNGGSMLPPSTAGTESSSSPVSDTMQQQDSPSGVNLARQLVVDAWCRS